MARVGKGAYQETVIARCKSIPQRILTTSASAFIITANTPQEDCYAVRLAGRIFDVQKGRYERL